MSHLIVAAPLEQLALLLRIVSWSRPQLDHFLNYQFWGVKSLTDIHFIALNHANFLLIKTDISRQLGTARPKQDI